jgi:hypothetical protein
LNWAMHTLGLGVVETLVAVASNWCNQSTMKALKKKESYESIWQWVQVCRETMEGDIEGLCDTKCQTCTITKDDDNALKWKSLLSRW